MQGAFREDEWNSRIARYPSKTVYHTSEWLAFIEESQGLEKVIYEIVMDEQVVGYLPGFIIKKGPIKIFGSPFPGWTTPYMGPLIDKTVPQQLFFKEFKKLMKKEGYHYAEIGNSILDIEIAKKENFIIGEGVTYIAEVKSSPEEILSCYNKTTRNCVRKAIKNGLVVETTTDVSFTDYYYAQLQEVFSKHKMKPTYSKDRVRLLIKKLLPSNKIMLTWVKYQDKVIASYIDVIDGLWMHSFGCVSAQENLKLCPNELARFHVMCRAAEKGVKHYDMTGGGTYKAKFGSKRTTTHTIIYSRYGLFHARNLAKKLIKLRNKIQCKLGR